MAITEQFLSLPEMLTPERFNKLFEKSLYWIAFRVNPADGELRNAERTLVYSLLDRTSSTQAPATLDTFKPWDPSAHLSEDTRTAELEKDIRNECVNLLLPKVEQAFATFIGRPESLRLLSSQNGPSSFLYVLFSIDRLPWGVVIRNALMETMGNARIDANAYEKANEFLQLLVDSAENSAGLIPRKSAEKIVEDHEFIAALWQGVISRHIQFRMLKSYLAKREALLQLGAAEGDLLLSQELSQAKETAG
jgi:hypothetical protein